MATSGESPLCGCWYLQDTGATPLYVASQEGHDAVVAALLASGAAVNQARTVGVGVLSMGMECVLYLNLRCCGFLGTGATLVSRVIWYVVGRGYVVIIILVVVIVVLSGWAHGGNELGEGALLMLRLAGYWCHTSVRCK